MRDLIAIYRRMRQLGYGRFRSFRYALDMASPI